MNKNSSVLQAIQHFYPDYHPLVSIAHLAHTSSDERLKFDCHKTIAKYVEPELKSLEVKGLVDDSRRVVVSMFQELDIVEAEVIPSLGHVVDNSLDDY